MNIIDKIALLCVLRSKSFPYSTEKTFGFKLCLKPVGSSLLKGGCVRNTWGTLSGAGGSQKGVGGNDSLSDIRK